MAKRHQNDKKKNTAAREDVARAMNSEMLVCHIDAFLEDYGPSPGIQASDIFKCKQYLLEAEILAKTEEGWRWKELLANPSCYPDLTDNEVFQPLETIIQGIWQFAKASNMVQNPYHFQLVPEDHLDDMIGGGDHLNACLLEQSYKNKIPNDIILVPWELNKEWTKRRQIKVQVLGDCHHILCEDVRRMFIYGVTMEDNRCSVWYFSRSHSVQSMPFLWNYKDGIDHFIHLILSFACATPQSLGIDSHVFKAPVLSEDGPQQYVYEFEVPKDSITAIPSPVGLGTRTSSTKEADTNKVKVYYRAVKGRVPMRPLCISGRITRVWEVVQVASVNDPPAANAERVILKDIWLDKSASTEGENLRCMFEAVEQFIADANSGRGGVRNVLDTDPRFQYFEDSTKERLAALLNGGRYKDLFLTQILEWHGDVTKPRSPRASPPSIPPQPRKIYAHRVYSQRRQEGHIFAGEVEAFLAEEERGKRGEFEEGRRASTRPTGTGDDEKDFGESSVKEKRILKIAKRFIDVSGRLTFIEPSLTTAKYEPQLAGTWPHEQYQQLFTLQSRILGSLALLITAFAKLDTKWCRALIHRTPYMNPNFLSDVFMTITILSNTLMSGTPLPASLPKLRDRIIYHSRLHGDLKSWEVAQTRKQGPMSSGSETAKDDSSLESMHNMEDTVRLDRAAGPSNVDGASMGFEDGQLTLDVLLNEQLPVYSTAIVALSNLISRLDDTMDIVKTLCGEASFQGYDALQRDFLDREEKSYGRY